MKKWACLILCSQLLANPNGASVMSGDVRMDTNGPLMEIRAPDRSIIHWDDFSIQGGETTRFIQPNSSAAVLNRVTGINPSMINGVLEANGRVILVNPHGVIVGGEGVIRVADFIGSTYDVLDLTDWSIKTDRGNAVHLSRDTSVINHEGVIEATGFQSTGGKVLLVADSVHMTGNVVAPQGTVELFGDKVILEQMAAIDVSGDGGGGIVRIGDDSLGSITLVGSGVQIHADAKNKGDGGSVILWSNEATQFHGTVTAHGGPLNGDGGFIEISSLKSLGCTGKVDASAPHGASGEILFDPCNITIFGGAPFGTAFTFPLYAPLVNSGINVLGVGNIEDALNTGNNVTITTSAGAGGTGTVTWVAGNPITWLTSNILTINADSDVVINSSITSTDFFAELEINSLTGSVNIEPIGVATPILIEVFGRVEISAGLDINLITTDPGQTADIRSKLVNVTAGRSVFLNPPTPTPGVATIQSFNFAVFPAPITIDAGRDVILGPSSAIISNQGPILVIADHNIEMRPNSTISYQFFAFGSIRSITLVVDDQAPTAPQIGDGAFIMDLGSAINVLGPIGPVQIFTARRSQNTVDGVINTALFVPGPLNVDTVQERWRVYYPNPFVNPNAPFFTIFYKEPQLQSIQALQATIGQAFLVFEEFSRPPAGYEDQFCVTECPGARGWSEQEKTECPWIEIDNYRKFYPSRERYGFVTIDHASIVPPQCDQ